MASKYEAKALGLARTETTSLRDAPPEEIDRLLPDGRYYTKKPGRKEISIFYRMDMNTTKKIVSMETPCYVWEGVVKNSGYGYIWYRGKYERIHRLAWLLAGKPIGLRMTLDHLGEIKACWNIDHMEEVTSGENNKRRSARKALRSTGGDAQ